jgi:hypothetical protein
MLSAKRIFPFSGIVFTILSCLISFKAKNITIQKLEALERQQLFFENGKLVALL